ncbi:tRNA (adenosine(37)-N6)-dimethylallyltransferase MiaA [Myxococcota bacterium]|nr:tRNA (adenosine(37)-N6)-dimethylallyltransferase MiaA [Myxococcota bacterium]
MSGRLLVLGGPTAAGKTALAMAIAERWPVRLVSADAMQVYRGLNIGTGKPSPEELRRFPHDNIDVRDPHEEFSAMDLADGADARLRAGEDVVVVGGTGFYLRALLIGFAPTPAVDPALRATLDALPDPHAALATVDPASAARLHPNDRVRVVRALEVFHLTGRPMSVVHAEHPLGAPRWPARRLWVDRPGLDARIDARVLQMVDQGYVAEVEGLLKAGVSRELKPMRSLGYRWMCARVAGEISLAEAIEGTQRDTRRFAKKQRQMLRSIGGFESVGAEDLDAVLHIAAETFGER